MKEAGGGRVIRSYMQCEQMGAWLGMVKKDEGSENFNETFAIILGAFAFKKLRMEWTGGA